MKDGYRSAFFALLAFVALFVGLRPVDAAYQPMPIGPQAASGALPVIPGFASSTVVATLPIAGQQVKSGSGSVLWYTCANATGGAVYIQVHSATAQPTGLQPLWYGAVSVGNNSTNQGSVGHTITGIPATNPWIVGSSTQGTYTALTSTALACTWTFL